MDKIRIILYLWIILILINLCRGCVFYARNGFDSETDPVRFIRVREDLPIGGEILIVKAFPRNSVKLKGFERSLDQTYFRVNELNSSTVQIVLNKSLEDLVDRDTPQNLLKFKIQCNMLVGRVEESSYLTVTIYVEDINDHYPKFMGMPYNVHVDESTPIGTTIYTGISAFDRDKPNTPNSDVQFSLGPQDYSGGPYFAIDSPHRPSLIMKRKLDYDEGIRKFDIAIIASDRGTPPKSSNTTIHVIVADSDDLPPKFSEGVYRTKIKEFSPLTGKQIRVPLHFDPKISAIDQDSLNASLLYEIISGNERQIFWVNPNTGTIYLEKEIDLEEETLPGNTFVLQLEARQLDSPSMRAIARIEIEIIDLNDNAPEFEVDLYNISIVENLPSGFSVLQVNAIDRDQGENSEFTYQLTGEKPIGAFLIDPRSGWLTVRDQTLLDREARQSVKMTVRAVEKIEAFQPRDDNMGKVEVEITLLDANDNTPEFEMGNLYEFKVNINAEIGHVVGFVKANDPDEGRNGKILYELQRPRTSSTIPFKLDTKTGALIVSGALNIGRIALFVEASDQPANPSERRFSLAVVTIEIVRSKADLVLDFIGSPYEFWVGSDVGVGTSVGQIRTTIDYDAEGTVMYDLLHSYPEGVPFAVEERSGTVTVIRRLEDFNRQHYEFEAVASHEAFANRHRSEKKFGQLIRRSSKSQKQVTHSGEIIEIQEGAANPANDMLITNVTIHIVNRDDDRGIIMRGTGGDPIEFHVKENVVGALIGQLLYTNKTSENKKEWVKENLQLTTNNSTGKRNGRQMSSTKFNRNVMKFNEIPANQQSKRRHRDTDSETSFYVAVTPSVVIEDLMEITPTPKPKSYRKVEEVETHSKRFYEKQEETDDLNHAMPPKIYENYKSQKSENRKRVRKAAGIVNAQRPVNDTYVSSSTIRNGGRQFITTLGPIVPTINRSTRIYTRIHSTPNPTTPTIPITIDDLDVPPPEALRYTNESATAKSINFEPQLGLRFLIANQQDVTDMITITNDGVLMTAKALDRETRDIYRLTVIAEYSKGFISGAGIYQVTIYVDDENDNAPTFNHNSYTGIITENCDVGTNVLLNQPIIVKDLDYGKNAEFSLHLYGEGRNLFTLELINGTENFNQSIIDHQTEKSFANLQIMFLESLNTIESAIPNYVLKYVGPAKLDRERETFYNLKLVAQDKGGLKSEANLGIFIADVNDNRPEFDKIAIFKNSGVEILENSPDIEIYYVDRLGDNDLDKLSAQPNLQYETSTPIGFGYPNDRLQEAMDRLTVGTPRLLNGTRYERKINARSATRRTKRNHKTTPTFSILESAQVGNSIIKVSATDEDYAGNSQIFYEIVSETYSPHHPLPSNYIHKMKFFNIDRLSGEIRINRPLPAESLIKLNITAKDIGNLADYTFITFKVIDVNDHQPMFEKSWYTFDLDEGTYTNHVVGRIEATDEDYGENSEITYKIQSIDAMPFLIAERTGILTINGELDREDKAQYEFKVMAMDNGSKDNKLYSFVEVEINVLDVNDNAPEFTGYDEIYQGGRLLIVQTARKLNNFNFYEQIDESTQNVDPVNDKIPIYKAYLNRNIETGALVKHVTATDKDFTGNGNGLVMYSLIQNKLPYMFEIDSREGIITTVSKLSNKYRGYEHINLTVIASDLGSPSMSSFALVLINLQGEAMQDAKDKKESIFNHKYYEIEITENNVVPMVILQINTTIPVINEDDDDSDANEMSKYRWEIITENDGDVQYDEFEIEPSNGTLWLVKSLDREMRDLYNLKIRAQRIVDREGRNIMYPISEERLSDLDRNEVRIIIRVLDENDHEPQFLTHGRPIVAVIPNTANFGYHVTTVKAIDGDIGSNAEIRYSLLNEPSKLFSIDSVSGRIRVIGHISNEKQRVFGFDVKATDRRGSDDGKSTISNVFVYVLDEDRQVRLVLAGQPIDIEKDIDSITKILSDTTSLDVRVRILEPHLGDISEPATDVYVYAIDPKTNAIVDMDDLQTKLISVDMNSIFPPLPIVEQPRLGGPKMFNARSGSSVHYGTLSGTELATIILAIAIFAGGLATTVCIVCVRYKRQRTRLASTNPGLAYSISKTPSSMRTAISKSSINSQLSIIDRPRLYSDNFSTSRTSYRDHEREYIDVPLPQSVLNSSYNMQEHEPNCLRFNQLRNPNPITNLDNSVTSLNSSGRDSGLDLNSRDLSDTNSRGPNYSEKLTDPKWNKITSCICHDRGESKKMASQNEESDSYEDSLKDMPLNRQTSFPGTQTDSNIRRNIRNLSVRNPNPNGINRNTVRHSFSGVRDDLVQNSPGPLDRPRLNGPRNSMTDLEERLRNIGITFHEPFILNNSRC